MRALWLLAFVAACSSSETITPKGAGVGPILRAHPAFASVGVDAETNASLAISRPSRADVAVRLDLVGQSGAWAELEALDVDPVAAHGEEGRVVFAAARKATDIVHVSSPQRFEELRILHDASAPSTFRLRVRRGPTVSRVRVEGRLVELLDRDDRVVLVGHPAWAEDARGVRRDVAVRLDGDVLTFTLDTEGLAYPIVVDPVWSTVAPMTAARNLAAAVTLPDGRVLVAGGVARGTYPATPSAEIYDAVANKWTSAGALPVSMGSSRMVLIPGGRALFAGGSTPNGGVMWTGGTSWVNVPMLHPHVKPVIVALADGRVLVAGGRNASGSTTTSTSLAEIFDPATATWKDAATMNEPRANASFTLLASGKVLVAGGEAGGSFASDVGNKTLSTVELYDPVTDKWSYTGLMADARESFALVPLPSGKVTALGGLFLVGGGYDTPASRTTYDPATGTWSAPTSFTRQVGLNPVRLTDGRFLLVSSVGVTTVYDPTSDSFAFTGGISPQHSGGIVAQLPGGKALYAGGFDPMTSSVIADAQVWAQRDLGVACDGAPMCKSGLCVDGVCCATSCAPGTVCNGKTPGTCTSVKGRSCTSATDCASGFCVDGVCCDRACNGQCEACDDPFSTGTCKTIAGAPHGSRTACSSGAGDACKATVCNGTDALACHPPAAGTVSCGEDTCSAGIERHVGTCNAAGTCVASSKSCGTYACGPTGACRTSCTASADCVAGYWCSGAACVPVLGLGSACSDASACGAGLFCVDGVCCGSSACGASGSCALAGHEGTCIKKPGAACSVDAECASGFCTDGVCCDVRCDGVCEACDVSAGTCTPVNGAPHGGRPGCARDTSDVCKSQACDGSTRDACAGFVGGDVNCRASSCVDAMLTTAAVCDGKGACPSPVTASCSGFTCKDTSSCRTTCADDGDCVEGDRCQGGVCKPSGDRCSDDGAEALPLGGAPVPCTPYVCHAGACATSCATSADCAPGTICDFGSKACIAPEAATTPESSGGCSASRRPGGDLGAAIGLIAVVLWTMRRRALAVAALTAGCSAREAPAPIATVRSATRELATFGLARANPAVRLPSLASEPLRVETNDGAWIEVTTPLADRMTLEGGAHVFTDRVTQTTVMFAHRADGAAEEVRVLDSPRAPTSFVYRIATAPGLSLRVREERVEAVDERGVVRVSSAPMWAVDAKGVRRDVHLTLEANRVVASLDAAGLAFPVVVDPVWTTVASMANARSFHAGVVLPSGKVLVAGGTPPSGSSLVSSAEIYDPAVNTWSSAGALGVARGSPQAALVGTKVVVVGGFDAAGTSLGNVDVYDTTTGTWKVGKPMPVGAQFHRVATVAGKVLVFMIDASTSTYLYDPATDSWTASTDMVDSHDRVPSVVLPSGAVYVFSGSYTNVSEKRDPTTGAWSAIAPMPMQSFEHSATLLKDGKRIFVAGGHQTASSVSGSYSTTEIYDTSTNTWTAGPTLPKPRDQHLAALLPSSGKVVVLSGDHNYYELWDDYAIFDLTASKMTSTGTFQVRSSAPILTLADGSLLVPGGIAGVPGDVVVTNSVAKFALQSLGVACATGDECASGNCVDFVCCSAASCASGMTCAKGTCAKKDGVTCAVASDCASGFCVDGVCCESACTSQCAACNVAGNIGKCRPVTGAPQGSRTACAATVSECGLTCNGADIAACHPRATGTPCGTAACTSGVETHTGACDGAGACANSPKPCGGYVCGGTTCKTACTTSADCASGYACATGVCVPLPGKGTDCSKTAACGPGLTCVDGVCCGSASCPADSTCPLGVGDCVKRKAASCAMDAECASGHCVDGVCCESTCTGPCGACDVSGHEGTCTPVLGKPRGARTCPSDGANPCAQGLCDGSDASSCNAHPGSDVSCAVATCKDGKSSQASLCDGKGSCPVPLTSECGAYRCNADATACRTRCTDAKDCVDGALCRDEKCIPLGGTCSSQDNTQIVASDGSTVSCAPFICQGGTCLTACDSSDQCAPGKACDTATRSCIAAAADTSDGGCMLGHAGSEKPWLLALLGISLAAARRRRVARR